MALKKNLAIQTGFSADYWNIAGIELDTRNQAAVVHFALYKDEATRRGGGTPVQTLSVAYGAIPQNGVKPKPFPFTVERMQDKNIYEVAYEEIKKDPFFQDALDV